jgi:hypothetical protein
MKEAVEIYIDKLMTLDPGEHMPLAEFLAAGHWRDCCFELIAAFYNS